MVVGASHTGGSGERYQGLEGEAGLRTGAAPRKQPGKRRVDKAIRQAYLRGESSYRGQPLSIESARRLFGAPRCDRIRREVYQSQREYRLAHGIRAHLVDREERVCWEGQSTGPFPSSRVFSGAKPRRLHWVVASYNVDTLNRAGRLSEVLGGAAKAGVHVLAMQGTRWGCSSTSQSPPSAFSTVADGLTWKVWSWPTTRSDHAAGVALAVG